MSKPLVIVESPTKAKTISKILGKDYEVTSSVGHVRDLPKSSKDIPEKLKEQVAWNGVLIEDGFKNVYVVPSDKEKVIKDLKKKLEKASEVYLASDEDREGESIAWHLLEELGPKIPVKRMVFHEITPSAINEAIENPRDININLVEAQEGRRTLDRMFGFELSKIMRVLGGNLSAGRVQSPAVKLIVEKEREREKFIKALYFNFVLKAITEKYEFETTIKKINEKRLAQSSDFNENGKLEKEERFQLNHDEVTNIIKAIQEEKAIVSSIDDKKYRRSPSAPFRTSTLQRSGSSNLGFSPSRTMGAAQKLYQEGYITYMRTDSIVLSDTAIKAARQYIKENFDKEYLPEEPRVYKSKVKNTQEAHEAIRPAGEKFVTLEEIKDIFEEESDEFKIYKLIFNQTIASQMNDAYGKTVTIEAEITFDSEEISDSKVIEKITIGTSGTIIEFQGFRLLQINRDKEQQELPKLSIGEEVVISSANYEEKYTSPPSRYSDSGLIETLENLGIGRPSTYASIISRITDVYVRSEGRSLIPEPIAFGKIDILQEHFPELVEYSFTAEMEDKLDLISNGKLKREDLLNDFWFGNGKKGLKNQINEEIIKNIDPTDATTIKLFHDKEGREIVLKTGRIVGGKARPYLLRDDGETATLPEDFTIDSLTQEFVQERFDEKDKLRALERDVGVDPDSGKIIRIILGPFGPYLQIGEKEKGKRKPKQGPIFKTDSPENLTLEDALERLDLPRDLGGDEEGWEYIAAVGPYGPYISRQKQREKFSKSNLNELKKEELLKIVKEEKIECPKSLNKKEMIEVIVSKTKPTEKHLNELSKDDVVSIAKQFKIRIPFKKLESVAKPRLIEKILYQKENRSLEEDAESLTITLEQAIEKFKEPPKRKQ